MMHYRTLVLSDIHLGTRDTKARELAAFLKHNSCDTLILNGDIVDVWHLRRRGSWRTRDTRIIRRILKMMEEHKTKVVYVRGNHDEMLDNVIPLQTGNFRIVRDMELESGGKRFFVTHGDIFDVITRDYKWLAHLGDLGYKLLLWLNKRHNRKRRLQGLPYDSLSQKVKHKVKLAVNYIGDFEEVMVRYAKSRHYDGIICGHIHQPAIKDIQGMVYMNSGDWVESLSALAEDHQGRWQVVYYQSIIPAEKQVL
jgi:UDP-2,3-diacylglucosamine pyrophosphatase LpxH